MELNIHPNYFSTRATRARERRQAIAHIAGMSMIAVLFLTCYIVLAA